MKKLIDIGKSINKTEYPPGPPEIFPYRLALSFISNPLPTIIEIVQRYGDISHFKFGPKLHVYLVNNPNLIENILVRDNKYFIKSPGLQLAKRVIGNGLITNEGESHMIQRKIISSAFSKEKIKNYGEIIVKDCIEYVKENWKDGMEINIHKEMTKLTLSIISKILFGKSTFTINEIDKISDSITIIIEYINKLRLPFLRFIEKIPIQPTIEYRNALKHLDEIIYSQIKKHLDKTTLSNIDNNTNDTKYMRRNNQNATKYSLDINNSGKWKDMLSILIGSTDEGQIDDTHTGLENPQIKTHRMTKKQLRDEVMTIFLAGHETTANALTWTLYLLAKDPKAEANTYSEIEHILDEKKAQGNNNSSIIEYEDLSKLKYTEKVLMESMRLYPPSWAIGRQVIKDYPLNNKYIIPSGSIIIVSQYLIHHDQRFYFQPNEFIPERWSIEFRSSIPRFSYFPFGGGPRGCIGEPLAWVEGILILANVIKNWRIILEEKTGEIPLQPLVTLRPKIGIHMRLIKRHL